MPETKENKMGVMPVPKLLVSMSLPIMCSMLVLALYNIVDSIFVSRYSHVALTAVSLAFPLQNLQSAVGIGTAVGVGSLISRNLGAGKRREAEQAASQGITLAVIGYAVFFLVGLFLARPFFRLFSDDEKLVSLGTTYGRICLLLSGAIFLDLTLERIMQATGDTVHPMIVQIAGALTNIIFDPIMIFGLCGFPAMGVAGAAYATVLGQHVSCLLSILFIHRNPYLTLDVRSWRLQRRTVREIYDVGLPSIIMQSIGTVMNTGMNRILIGFGMEPVAVFGIYFKLQSFVFMPVFGLNNGLIPIVGYNYGAKRPRRINEAIRTAVLIATAIMALGTLVFRTFPGLLLSWFHATPAMLEVGLRAFPTLSLCFVAAGVSICLSSLFQGIGDGVYSMVVSLTRQLGVLLPTAFLLSRTGGLGAVWYAFLIAESVSLTLVIVLFVREYRRKVRPLASS